MGLHIKNLREGKITSNSSAAPTVLYPEATPNARGTLIKSLVLYNPSSTTDVKVHLKIRPASASGDDRYIAPVGLALGKFQMLELGTVITLQIGPANPDQIVAWVDVLHTNNEVTYVLSGIERDQ